MFVKYFLQNWVEAFQIYLIKMIYICMNQKCKIAHLYKTVFAYKYIHTYMVKIKVNNALLSPKVKVNGIGSFFFLFF